MNKTNSELYFDIYGLTAKTETKLFYSSIQVESQDTNLVYPDTELENFDKIKIVCTNGVAIISEVTCHRNDMYFYIISFSKQKPQPILSPDENSKKNSSQEQETSEPEVSYDKFHFSYEQHFTNIKYAFGNAKIWIAENFSSANSVIQIEDRETGTIVGKASDVQPALTTRFTFKIKIRENKAKIEFYNYYIYTPILDVTTRPHFESEYESYKAQAKNLAEKFFTTIETE